MLLEDVGDLVVCLDTNCLCELSELPLSDVSDTAGITGSGEVTAVSAKDLIGSTYWACVGNYTG